MGIYRPLLKSPANNLRLGRHEYFLNAGGTLTIQHFPRLRVGHSNPCTIEGKYDAPGNAHLEERRTNVKGATRINSIYLL